MLIPKHIPVILVLFGAILPGGGYAGQAEEMSAYLERLRKFDISCKFMEGNFQKKETGLEHRSAFAALIREPDKPTALRRVEEALAASRSRLKEIEGRRQSAHPANPAKTAYYVTLVDQAQQGDSEALKELKALGLKVIPALYRLKNEKLIVPSPDTIALLSDLEHQADVALSDQATKWDVETWAFLIQREKEYIEILKRAIIALEGTRRPYSHWLPLVYMFGGGAIPFLFGIIAAVIYYEGFRFRVFAVIAASYLLYLSLVGFFQLFAPWIN